MKSHETEDLERLARENRVLRKKLARIEQKVESVDTLRQQNSILMRSLMGELETERAESDRLLLNILPAQIAERLKAEPGVIADRFESVSVMFADVVGFTPLSDALSAVELVEWLNVVYSGVDALVQQHGVEKIRTIGDGYMVAAGVPFPRGDHAVALVGLALDMREHFRSIPTLNGQHVSFRMGISSGPVVGGVIGTHKFQYDIWGDTVNTASRMESHGIPDQIQVSPSTYEMIKDEFSCETRGLVNVKGKGEIRTWLVRS